MHPEIGPVDRDEGLAEVTQAGLAGRSDVPLGHHHPHRSPFLQPAEPMDTDGVMADPPFRLFGGLYLGDQ